MNMNAKFSIFTAYLVCFAVFFSLFFLISCNKNAQENFNPVTEEINSGSNFRKEQPLLEQMIKDKDFIELANLLDEIQQKRQLWLKNIPSGKKQVLYITVSNYRKTKEMPKDFYLSEGEVTKFANQMQVIVKKINSRYKNPNKMLLNEVLTILLQEKVKLSNGRVEDNCGTNYILCTQATNDIYWDCMDTTDYPNECLLGQEADQMGCNLGRQYCEVGSWDW
jgi:hypothetical protein